MKLHREILEASNPNVSSFYLPEEQAALLHAARVAPMTLCLCTKILLILVVI